MFGKRKKNAPKDPTPAEIEEQRKRLAAAMQHPVHGKREVR